MKTIEDSIKLFREKFTCYNRSVDGLRWWIVPSSGQPEVASPFQVEDYLRQKLLSIQRQTREEMYNRLWEAGFGKSTVPLEGTALLLQELLKIRDELTQTKEEV